MARVFCRFCGHRWDKDLLILDTCPVCEYANTPDMFQVLQLEEAEFLRVWNVLQECFGHKPAGTPDKLTTLFVPKTEREPWQKLVLDVLIYDQVFVCEQWKLLFSTYAQTDSKYIPSIMKLYDADLVRFVDDPETLPPARVTTGLRASEALSDFGRIVQSDRFVELPRILSRHSKSVFLQNYWALDKLASFQASRLLSRESKYRSPLLAAYALAYPGGGGPDLYDILTQANRFQMLAVLLDTQLSLHHDWISPLLTPFSSLLPPKSALINEVIFDNKFVFVPDLKNVDRVLEIRNSREFTSLRQNWLLIRNITTSDFYKNLSDIKKQINDDVERLNRTIAHRSELIALTVSGLMASAGSLLGGLPGAIVGGIGGAVIGKSSSYVSKRVFAKVNKRWTMLISHFIGNNQ